MKIFSQAWNNFRTQPDVWFFYGFLATFILTIRKVLINYSIAGQFNEWTGVYLYLSDILIALTLISWIIIILQNKKVILSIAFAKLWLKKAPINFPLILVIWSFCSIFWSENQNIALFRAIKLFELYFLYIFIIFRVFSRLPREIFINNLFRIIITLGFIQAIIGIYQFIIQHSVGLFWLKESLIYPNIDGVAKIVFNGEKYIRAYGLFPHPNILGGFLLISIILTWTYGKMFHPSRDEIVSRETKLEHGAGVKQFGQCHSCAGGNPENFSRFWIKSGMTFLLFIQIVALILTFSKSAIIGLLIAIGYISWKNKQLLSKYLTKCHSCESRNPVKLINIFSGFRIKSGMTSVLLVIILILSLYLLGLNFRENLNTSLGDRSGQLEIWKSVISDGNPLFGSGIGSYMFHMEQIFPGFETWQYQPIHNVFLLILAELGFIGLFIFTLFLWKIYKTPSPYHRGEGWGEIFKGILLGLVFIMLLDHYLWDIQQGQIMLWIVLGIVVGARNSGKQG